MADKPTLEQRQAMLDMLDMLDKCDREAWIATVKYCARELIAEQGLLAEIVCRRAEKNAEATGNGHYPADHIASVLKEVGLKITLAEGGDD